MRKILFFYYFIITLPCIAQMKLVYTLSSLPVFINKSGDTLNKALAGGLNQPQFQAIDINNDGKKDMVIHEHVSGMILPFINKGSEDITTYKYEPKYADAFPKMTNTWFLLVDYDKDGKEDLWTNNDYKANTNYQPKLYRNITKPGDKKVKFSLVVKQLKAYNFGTPPLDSAYVECFYKNIPTIGDVDGDGDIDIFSYESNQGNLLLYRNITADFKLPLHPPVFDLADFCWGNFKESLSDSVNVFSCNYKQYRKKHGKGSALLWLDNDADGDMDLLMGTESHNNIIYLKNGKADFGLKTDSIIAYNLHWPDSTAPVNLNSFAAAFMLDADGDSIKDILVAPNAINKIVPIEETGQVWFYKNTGTNKNPVFQFNKKNYFTDEFLDHGGSTDPVLYDIDGDSDLDLIIASTGDHAKTGDKSDRLFYYTNIGTNKIPVFKLENEDLWGLSKDSIMLLSVAFGDLNGDGKPDMLAGNYFGTLSFYANKGSNMSWEFSAPIKDYQNIKVSRSSSPQIIDLDKDGLLDLVIGEYDGMFKYFKNTGTSTLPKFTKTDDTLGNFFINETILDPDGNPYFKWFGDASGEISDLDNDGKQEFVSGGDEGKVRFYRFDKYNQKNYLEDTTVLLDSSTMLTNTMDFGLQSKPTVGDLDGDGIKDIIVGNNRGGIQFLKGALVKAGVGQIKSQNELSVYPNPTHGSLLNIRKPQNQSYTFSIFDLSGQLIQTEVSIAGTDNHKMKLNTVCDGIYILQSEGLDNTRFFTRVVILK